MRIVNVMAVSLDGFISAGPNEGEPERLDLGFTSEADAAFVRSEIGTCDAIVTGAQSVRVSGELWNAVGAGGKFPHWYVATRKGLEPDLPFWTQDSIPRTILSPSQLSGFPSKKVGFIRMPAEQSATFMRNLLIGKKFEKVLLFGGGYINRLFYQENLVDELKITICPLLSAKKQRLASLIRVFPVRSGLSWYLLKQFGTMYSYTIGPKSNFSSVK